MVFQVLVDLLTNSLIQGGPESRVVDGKDLGSPGRPVFALSVPNSSGLASDKAALVEPTKDWLRVPKVPSFDLMGRLKRTLKGYKKSKIRFHQCYFNPISCWRR